MDGGEERAGDHGCRCPQCATLSTFLFLTCADTLGVVNNVGRSHSIPVDFAETPEDEIDNILKINVNATVHVTRAIVPGMAQRYVATVYPHSPR